LRGGASTRFHPKRRASTDHSPGPNIARAAPMAPSKSGIAGSAGRAKMTCPTAVKATNVPAIGVHRPAIRRIAHPARNAAVMVVCVGGLFHTVGLARITNAEPIARRMRSKPVPGQPPANVEYRRRNDTSLQLIASDIAGRIAAPKRVELFTL